jgi:hypothetical protein
MNQNSVFPEHQMMQFILGKWISKPINVAAKLGIADLLSEEPKTIDELTAATNTKADPLCRLMRALSGVGIFVETENGIYANTPMSEYLREGRLKASSLLFHSTWHDAMWDNLLYSIQTGESAFEKVNGESVFKWFENHPDEARIFHEANLFKATSAHKVVADVYDFSQMHFVSDVGGGFGGLLIEILKMNPHLKGTVADVPEVVREAEKIIKDKNLESRMNAIVCDFSRKSPKATMFICCRIFYTTGRMRNV